MRNAELELGVRSGGGVEGIVTLAGVESVGGLKRRSRAEVKRLYRSIARVDVLCRASVAHRADQGEATFEFPFPNAEFCLERS